MGERETIAISYWLRSKPFVLWILPEQWAEATYSSASELALTASMFEPDDHGSYEIVWVIASMVWAHGKFLANRLLKTLSTLSLKQNQNENELHLESYKNISKLKIKFYYCHQILVKSVTFIFTANKSLMWVMQPEVLLTCKHFDYVSRLFAWSHLSSKLQMKILTWHKTIYCHGPNHDHSIKNYSSAEFLKETLKEWCCFMNSLKYTFSHFKWIYCSIG